MKEYTILTLKACWKRLLVLSLIALGFWVLIQLSQIQVTADIKFAIFGIKIGILAIIIPYITASLKSFYVDIKLFKRVEYKQIVEYYEPPFVIIFCAAVVISCSMFLDCIFLTTCHREIWNLGMGALMSGTIGLVWFSFYLLVRGIGEMETFKKISKEQVSSASQGEKKDNNH
jgi:hypothetical protein